MISEPILVLCPQEVHAVENLVEKNFALAFSKMISEPAVVL